MTDETLRTDPAALLAHRDFVRGIVRAVLWDEHAAEDVVQETWIASLDGPAGPPRGWLAVVARNLAIKRLRGDRRRALREAAAGRPEGVPSDADVLERERARRNVVDAVLALAEPYRGTILLRYFENLPPREVARRTGAPVETVRTRTRRAIALLRERLEADHGHDREAFCGALLAWAGDPPHGSVSTGAGVAAAAAGASIVGTKATVTGMALVVACAVAWLLWPARDAAQEPEEARASATASVLSPRPRAAPVAQDAATVAPDASPPVSIAPVVRGRVTDTAGRPAAGLDVLLLGASAPAEGAAADPVRATTDAEGFYEVTAAAEGACRVQLSRSTPEFEAVAPRERTVNAPAAGIDFVVERHPTAVLVVTATDAESGAAVRDFRCSFGGKDLGIPDVRTDGQPSKNGAVEARVRLGAATGDTVRVAVLAGVAVGEREVLARDGDHVDVRVELRRDSCVRGRTVDAQGRPIANALVFFGEEEVARGDEPFKPFVESRVRDGVRTDADGRFELRGRGRWITAWHTDASPVTVAAAGVSDLVLPARGAIRGVLRGADGAPIPSGRVFLDRTTGTTTDAEGRFAFDGVEAGLRGLSVGAGKPKGYVALRVSPGATAVVALRPGIPSVRISWPGRASFGRGVALVPLGAVGSLAIGTPADGAVVVRDLMPGPYLLLGEGGVVGLAEVSASDATVDAGRGEVVVRARAGSRVWVVPEGGGPLARLLAGRQAGSGVPADGVQRFSGLRAGRYEVGVEGEGVHTTVAVADDPVTVEIEDLR